MKVERKRASPAVNMVLHGYPAHIKAAYDVSIMSSHNLSSLSSALYKFWVQFVHLRRECLSYHFIPGNEKGTGSVTIAIKCS